MKPQYSAENGMLIDGNYWLVHPQTGEGWDEDSIDTFIATYKGPSNEISLDDLKQATIAKIKQQAGERIDATNWQLQRAQDRVSQAELLAINDAELETLAIAEAELLAVLDNREAIRQASNDAETQVKALDTLSAIEAFSW